MISINLALTTCITFFFGWYYFSRYSLIFNTGSFFNGYAFLYFVVGILLYLNEIPNYDEGNIQTISMLCIFAVTGFNTGFFTFGRINKTKISGRIPSYQTVLAFFLVGVIANLTLIAIAGPSNLLFVDRLDRFPVLNQAKYLVFFSKAANIACVVGLIRYFAFRENKDKKLCFWMVSYLLFFALATISRSDLVFIFIAAFALVEINKIVSSKKIILAIVALTALMLSYKGLLYLWFLGDAEYGTYNPGEFINWIRNSNLILRFEWTHSDFENNSYFLALKSLFLINPGGDALSEWFIREFYPDRVVAGLTYGFSGLIEGYMQLGALGVFLHFAIIGVCMRWLEHNPSIMKFAIKICALFIMFRLFRSEIYNFSRTFAWFYVYQICFLFFVDWLFFFSRHNIRAK